MFWFVLILFVAAAVERLQLTIAAALLSGFAALLPRVLVGLIILFGSILPGHAAYAAVNRAAAAAGLPQAGLLARSVQLILIFLGIVTAADQIGIQSTLLTVVVATALGAVLGGATLAFGLGSRTAVSNIVAVFYLLKTYRVGQVVRIGDVGVFLWSGSFALCLVTGLAMVMSMTIAGVAGAGVPMLLSASGQDPAQSSSIVLTTVTDVMGFLSFLGLAALFSSWL